MAIFIYPYFKSDKPSIIIIIITSIQSDKPSIIIIIITSIHKSTQLSEAIHAALYIQGGVLELLLLLLLLGVSRGPRPLCIAAMSG